MKRIFSSLVFVLSAAALICFLPSLSSYDGAQTAENSKPSSVVKTPNDDIRHIAALAAGVMQNRHYTGRKFDREYSEMVFDEYLRVLDPSRIYFTQKDVDSFLPERPLIAEKIKKGDTNFAFDAFNLVTVRIMEYKAFAEKEIANGIKLDTNDSYMFDRKKSSWPKDEAEQKVLWKKKLASDLIILTLADRAAELEAKEKKEKNVSEEKNPAENPPVSSFSKSTPEKKLLHRVNQTAKYNNSLEPIEVLELYLSSFSNVLDPHSNYMCPKSDEMFDAEMSLSLIGIGAVLTSDDGYTKIVEIMPGGPADKDGRLKAGDRIIAVAQENQEPVDIMDMPLKKVVSLIRGKKYTRVTLTVLKDRNGVQSVPEQITIEREKVTMKDAEASGSIIDVKNADGSSVKIGILDLPSFYIDFAGMQKGLEDYKSSSNDVKKILENFNKEKVDCVILDLRSNPGGSLFEAVRLMGLFIKDGPVVQVRSRKSISVNSDEDETIVYDGALVVLINSMSASASEIVAAAVKDYRRGIIIGDKNTHGKGTVQTVAELDPFMPFFTGRKINAGTLSLTNAKFYRINGESTQLKGVEPDIVLPSITGCLDIGEATLDYALTWDVIKPTEYKLYEKAFFINSILPSLKEKSSARVKADKDFIRIGKDIEEYKKIKDRKTVSLNLETRWKEYLEEKEAFDKEDDAFTAKKSTAKDKVSNEEKLKSDPVLREAVNVSKDFVNAEKNSEKTVSE